MIDLAHISPQLELKLSKRARRVALRLDTSRRVVNLVVPMRFSMRKAELFALQHKDWIRAKLSELPEPVTFTHGAKVPVFGRQRTIEISYDKTLKRSDIYLKENSIFISTNQDNPAGRITRFLKSEARDTLANLANEKAAEIGKTIKDISIRDPKSRWGSCAPDGRICFSWRLIFAPWESLDYVVAHEVAHLVHMNHGKHFWELCERLSEDYHTGKHWIRNNGHELMRYGQHQYT